MGDMSEPVAWMLTRPDGQNLIGSDDRLTKEEIEAGWTERALVYADDLDAANKLIAELEAKEADWIEAGKVITAAEARIAELERMPAYSAYKTEWRERAEAAEARTAELERGRDGRDEIIAALENELTAAEARIKVLTEAIEAARKTMRNCWGAVTSNQVADKDVEGQLKQGLAALASLEPK